jgi:hypothetical protein
MFERLAILDDRYKALADIDPLTYTGRTLGEVNVTLLAIDASLGPTNLKLEETYSWKQVPSWTEGPDLSQSALEAMNAISKQQAKNQVLVHSSSNGYGSNIPLIAAIGDQYDIDPEICLMLPEAVHGFVPDHSHHTISHMSPIPYQWPEEAFPSDRNIIAFKRVGVLFAAQLCRHRTQSDRTLCESYPVPHGPHSSTRSFEPVYHNSLIWLVRFVHPAKNNSVGFPQYY